MRSATCDFCHQRGGVRWEYPATDFIFGAAAYDVDTGKVMMERELHSKGGWAACQRCADLVDSGYYDTLAFVCAGVDLERTRYEDLRPGQKSVLLTMRGAISAFRANRVGRRRPFNPDTP